MDLNDKEHAPDHSLKTFFKELAGEEEVPTASHFIETFDKSWYAHVNGRARWMDLIGDFAGTERFVVDGDALFEVILDDPLLALARNDDPSFQVLHARWVLEHWLQNLLDRDAVFDVVFWDDNRHLSIQTGPSAIDFHSRSLARRLLFHHLLGLGEIAVHVFNGTDDPNWLDYLNTSRPMFVMTNDGGSSDCLEAFHQERVLLRRVFVFFLLTHGLSVVLLKDVQFCDHKILSFVLEATRVRHSIQGIPPRMKTRILNARAELDQREEYFLGGSRLGPLSAATKEYSPEEAIAHFCRRCSQKTDATFRVLFHCFVTHMLALKRISLSQRSLPAPVLNADLAHKITGEFYPVVLCELERSICETGHSPDLDGRVFASIVHFLCQRGSSSFAGVVGGSIASAVASLYNAPLDLEILRRYPNPRNGDANVQDSQLEAATVLPFSNTVFDEELQAVQIRISGPTPFQASTKYNFFDYGNSALIKDDRHWHAARAILPNPQRDAEHTKLEPWQEKRRLKRQQREMARMQRHAMTLTGALGLPLQPTVIVATRGNGPSQKNDRSPTMVPHRQGKQQKGKKADPPKSSADKLREKIAAEKLAKKGDETAEWWGAKLTEHAAVPSAKERAIQTDALFRNKRAEEGWLALEIRLYRIHLEFLTWIEGPNKDSGGANDLYTVSIMRLVKSLCERKTLSQVVLDHIEMILFVLGFSDYHTKLCAGVSITQDKSVDRKPSFKFVKLLKNKSSSLVYEFMHIREAPALWQLRLFGEYMDRSMDGKPDKRVAFEPDGWQRKVLDCLDEKKSVLVVAPTSAGKTFISFYAMEQVLRESDNGILVYVAPTKALVNQIAAEIYARFQKSVPAGSCWAVHTRDHRINDPQKCQILVTVPEMFAIMLLSPPLARVWTPRIKWIILDEIHSIGQQEGGAIWEQIILFAPCPIIGLSATVGHPEKFNQWLESVQKAHKLKHEFVYHPHRYSHLRKHVFVQHEEPFEFDGLKSYEPSGRLHFLHPISLVAPGTPLPSDFTLEARDTLTLYNALGKVKDQLPADVDIDRLQPSEFFSSDQFLRQQDILQYEAELKNIVVRLMSTDDSSVLREVMRLVEEPELSKIPKEDLYITPSPDAYLGGLMCLLVELHRKNCLPALFFSFDRSNCEEMLKVVLNELEEAEERWRTSSPEWRSKLSQWKAWQDRKHRRLQGEEKEKKRPRKGKRDDEREAPEPAGVDPEDAKWASFDPDDPLPDFSFANTMKYQASELLKDIDDLKWTSTPDWAIKALKRGIGVHHAGMNKGYRTTIESLFRLGYLRVLFATGTLALGINAPTKTSVFCGDSPYLTALTYRQCAGRAGRRGHDLLGNVVFYGIPMDRIQRLVLSQLPSLSGNFPLTSTLTARLLSLLHGSNNSDYAVYAIRSVTRLPQISFGSTTGRDQLLHHLRFSIEYLRRAGLLDINGRPMNLYNIAAHLYHTEPNNFALVALIRAGVIHGICNRSSLVDAKEKLMVLFCHLFGRRHLPAAYTSSAVLDELRRNFPSRIILEPLGKDAQRVLKSHNEEILRVFSAYARLFSMQRSAELGADNVLPLSHVAIEPENARDELPSQLHNYLEQTRIRVSTRSLFVANSGVNDTFRSVEDLVRTCRSGLHLNERAIPTLSSIIASGSGGGGSSGPRLNSYIMDFYKHGQVTTLARANGIRRGDVWYALNDFLLAMLSVRNALQDLLRMAAEIESDKDEESENEETDEVMDSEDLELSSFPRPKGVTDEDWRVYEVLDKLIIEFNEKFRKMWA